jgi:hypothetical protein
MITFTVVEIVKVSDYNDHYKCLFQGTTLTTRVRIFEMKIVVASNGLDGFYFFTLTQGVKIWGSSIVFSYPDGVGRAYPDLLPECVDMGQSIEDSEVIFFEKFKDIMSGFGFNFKVEFPL